ncbi:receptor-like protein kinase FERONIA [Bidens hawaiensis]|uniref:receptor-like protein kinase FERONIA n=1 Tax=Bidens hawaiensis TaxID=980011 RepID=UPI00404A5C5D
MSAPLQIPLKEVEAVTNNFDDENFIGEGFLGKIYKGQLPLEGGLVDVAVRRLDNSLRLQEMAFDKEISILSRLKHENMVSIVGFCYENDEMLIINKRVARGSLRRYLRDPRLTWMRRLQISVGVVRALSYLHSFGIIHHNINSNSILLDENWEAKISGFEYSMTIPAGHLDLAYEKLGMGTYKSDVFSLGIVLFELLCGRETFLSKEDNSFQTSSATFHFENREFHKFVDPDLFSQMDQLSFNIFSRTAYNCLIKQREPPTMDEILKRLERALQVQLMYENNV